MATYKFGIVVSPNHTEWLVQNASETTSAQEALALDGDGAVCVAHYYQKVLEKTLEVIIPEPAQGQEWDIPEVGDVVQYGTENSNPVYYYVSGATRTETNTDFVRFSITVKRFTDADKNHPVTGDWDASESIFVI